MTTSERIKRGEQFLEGLFDPSLGLLPEYPGSKTYWLYHDNYLAANLLEKSHPDISRRIRASISGFRVLGSGKIEIVFGEVLNPLPFRGYELIEVATMGDKVIKTERVTNEVANGWRRYADLLLLASMAKFGRAARKDFFAAEDMWDGAGFLDVVARHTGIFATYKLALYLIAARRLRIPPIPEVFSFLKRMQNSEGGWITDYKNAPTSPVGFANVETTGLALLALK